MPFSPSGGDAAGLTELKAQVSAFVAGCAGLAKSLDAMRQCCGYELASASCPARGQTACALECRYRRVPCPNPQPHTHPDPAHQRPLPPRPPARPRRRRSRAAAARRARRPSWRCRPGGPTRPAAQAGAAAARPHTARATPQFCLMAPGIAPGSTTKHKWYQAFRCETVSRWNLASVHVLALPQGRCTGMQNHSAYISCAGARLQQVHAQCRVQHWRIPVALLLTCMAFTPL